MGKTKPDLFFYNSTLFIASNRIFYHIIQLNYVIFYDMIFFEVMHYVQTGNRSSKEVERESE